MRSSPIARVSVLVLSVIGGLSHAPAPAADFADTVVDYLPAPGQRINNAAFNDPARAVGAPIGGGTLLQNNTKLVTLGGFGGRLVLKFSSTVLDDPRNPYGLDAIVFGNAVYASGDANRRFAESGVIEISRDMNGNGLADDPWYLIPGSHLPAAGAPTPTVAWDNSAGTPTPPSMTSWYPSPVIYPGFPAAYSTSGFQLPPLLAVQVLENPLGPSSPLEGVRGYADFTPVLVLGDLNVDNVAENPAMSPAEFYTFPDNPHQVGVTPGSGGGDAFDVRWAVDPATGLPADLGGFDFIRIRTGLDAILGALGELSTEIGAVADVRPRESFFDLTGDGEVGVEDLYAQEQGPAGPRDMDGDDDSDSNDRELLVRCVRHDENQDMTP